MLLPAVLTRAARRALLDGAQARHLGAAVIERARPRRPATADRPTAGDAEAPGAGGPHVRVVPRPVRLGADRRRAAALPLLGALHLRARGARHPRQHRRPRPSTPSPRGTSCSCTSYVAPGAALGRGALTPVLLLAASRRLAVPRPQPVARAAQAHRRSRVRRRRGRRDSSCSRIWAGWRSRGRERRETARETRPQPRRSSS